MVIEPVPLTLMFALTTVVSKSIPVVASAVNTSAVTSSLSSVPSWVIAPVPAFRVTSPVVPALIRETAMPFPVRLMLLLLPVTTSVAVINPVAETVIDPLVVSTSVRVRSPSPSSRIVPTVVLEASTLEPEANSSSWSENVA